MQNKCKISRNFACAKFFLNHYLTVYKFALLTCVKIARNNFRCGRAIFSPTDNKFGYEDGATKAE